MTDITITLETLGSHVITPAAPCGAAARYEPEYERLEGEMAKLESLTAANVEWREVVNLGATILHDKSKDLLVASYLSRALFEQQGYAGLATALTIYHDMLTGYWDGLFPPKKRLRGRIQAAEWMAEKLGGAIARRAPEASEQEAVARCRELTAHISQLLDELLGQAAPELTPLSRALRDVNTSIAQDTPPAAPPTKPEEPAMTAQQPGAPEEITPVENTALAPPAEPQQPAPAPPTAAAPAPPQAPTSSPQSRQSAPAIPTEFQTDSEVQRALRHCTTVFEQGAAFLLRNNPANPLPYRLLRLGAWMMVTQAPLTQGGVTQLVGVQPHAVQGYEEQLQQADYATLIPQVEASFANAPFWFEAHRLTVSALTALGVSHDEARKTVISELANFLRRVPGVLELKFVDGTPFASEQTRAWIDTEVLSSAATTGASPMPTPRVVDIPASRVATEISPPSNGAHTAPSHLVIQEANQLAAEGQKLAGVALFQAGQQQATAPRERFVWRLHQARFCLGNDLLAVALPQLEFLLEQVDRFALEEWEPMLSLEVMQLLLSGYYQQMQQAMPPAETLIAKTERLYARLCCLDVTAVLAVVGA